MMSVHSFLDKSILVRFPMKYNTTDGLIIMWPPEVKEWLIAHKIKVETVVADFGMSDPGMAYVRLYDEDAVVFRIKFL